MRSNKINGEIFGQAVKHISQTVKSWLMLGVTGRQWLAILLICILLSPMFSLPARATVVMNAPESNAGDFEPVNEPLPIWKAAGNDLNARLEEFFTAMRNNGGIISDKDDDDKNKSAGNNKSEKDEKDMILSEDEKNTREKSNSEESSAASAEITSNKETAEDNDSAKSSENVEADFENTEAEPMLTGANKLATSPTTEVMMINQLPDTERESVYSYENNLGAPPGQVEMDSPNTAVATKIRHRVGIANYSFDVPLAALSGRGIDAGVGMTYNSRTWNKSCIQYDQSGNCTQNHFTYDVEQSWVAPGFSSGFGYLESVAAPTGSYGYYKVMPAGITDADGTRHQLVCRNWSGSACLGYETSDGTFIKTSGQAVISNLNGYANTTFTAVYPNGSKVTYRGPFGSGTNRKHYPVDLQDSNGNRVRIAYKADQSGRIDYIVDTLNRQIRFYYEADASGNPDKLVAVTVPGMNANEELQTVRFYYGTATLQPSGFASPAQVTPDAATTIRVLKFVHFPSTKTGFRYDYHPSFGMITKISRMVGMAISDATNLTATGTVLNEGNWAATTEYNYPDGSAPVTDVPKYTKRTDDWQGRTSGAAAETFYSAPEPTAGQDRISTVTVKDANFDIDNKTISYNTIDWQNGLLKETSVTKTAFGQPSVLMAKTKYFWEQGQVVGGRQNPRLQKVETTNEAGQTKATRFEYNGYNNQTVVEEYDFAAPGALGASLKRTETTYETGSDWIGANLLGLPKSAKTIAGGITVSKTLIEYDHNGSDASLTRRDDMDSATHSNFYNPAHPAWTEEICPRTIPGEPRPPGGCVIIHHPGYNSYSAYRGNVTRVTRFADATLATDPNADVTDYNYDIAGNLVSATLSCCQLKTLDYGDDFGDTGYAYPIKETKGTSPQLITEAAYNINTGLVISSKDENGQMTNYEYEQDTLRQKKTIYPNGGYTLTEYSDKLISDPTQLVPGFVRQTTTLDTNKTAQSYSYFDGRGASIRSAAQTPDDWSISAVEYDTLGRAKKSYNPFYASTPNGGIPTGTKYTEVLNTDALGRTTEVRLQDNTTVSTAFSDTSTTPAGFNKTFVTVTDQAGKQRRQIADALGRVTRVDEPDTNGNLGDVTVPTQPTAYEYDGNDNLSKVIQSDGTVTQERLFKYDSLSRLTSERQVEANATLNDAGTYVGAGGQWTKVLKYDSHGLLTDGFDARGVRTQFTYDGLNRVKTVSFSDGTPSVTYTYDQARSGYFNTGALTRVETAVGDANLRPDTPDTASEFDYDNMGRVVNHRNSIGTQIYPLEYGYNLAGQLTSEKYPSGKVVTMGYDANGRLASIADQSRTFANNFQYQTNGGMLSAFNLGNGTTQSFGFNERLQMTQQNLTKGAEVIQKYDYGYGQIDASGNLDTTKNNGQLGKIESYIGVNKQWTQKFSYDSLGRLSESSEYRGDTNALSYKQKFDFDRFGNLYRKQSSNPAAGQATPLPFTPIEEADISKSTNRFTTNTTYDDAGNVTQDAKFRNLNYSYDTNGRMFKTSNTQNTNQANSVYDASGNRVAQQIDNVWTFFVYDAFGKMVAEYGGIQSIDEGGVKYILSDWQGSSRAIIGQTGVVQARMDYTAFGEEINAGTGLRTTSQGFNANNNLSQKYALTERDKATGLDHTTWRKNENRAGRWTSPDPYDGSASISSPQSFNRYSYVENQPTNFVDPSGLNMSSGESSGYCIRYHYYNPATGEGFWGAWTCYGGGGESSGGGGGPAPLTSKETNKLNKSINKINKSLQKKKCKGFLESHNVSISDLVNTLGTHERFSGPRSTNITVEESGLLGPNARQNAENLPPSLGRDSALRTLSSSVSNWFKNAYSGNVQAAVATGASNPATVYYRNFGTTTTLHENLHISTGLNDIDLANKLGLKHNGTTPSASMAISAGLKANGCS